MTTVPKLTTIAACRVVGMNRDRFNEHVSEMNFECAPGTVAGRSRLFDPNHMVALWLFNEMIERDKISAKKAGTIACEVAELARRNLDENAIAFIELDMGSGYAAIPADVPDPARWSKVLLGGRSVRKVTYFNIHSIRERIATLTEEERSIIGPDDE